MEGEMFLLVTTKDKEATMTWDKMTIPCPMQYITCALYYYGHLNNDQIVSVHSQSELEDKSTSTAAELAKKREHQTLEETNWQVSKKTEGDKSDCPKDDTTLMEVENSIQKLPQGETVPPTEETSVAMVVLHHQRQPTMTART